MNIETCLIHCSVVNFSMQQNHVPVIREIIIRNTNKTDLDNINVRLSFEPDFAQAWKTNIGIIPAQGEEHITVIPIKMYTKFLSGLTERMLGMIKLEIIINNKIITEQSHELTLLAFDQWGGLKILPEMLSVFVTPNHPIIAPILKRSSEILENWTGSPALDEYQTRDPNRVKKQMAAIYEAISEQHITYCTTPANFEEEGQRIRLYDTILNNKLGNCLDMTLLYTGCLEAIGIHPLIIITEGHAFAGGWLIGDSFPDSVNDDISLLTKRIAEGINEILPVETTYMNKGSNIPFDSAVNTARDKLADSSDFLLFIDILRSRFVPIRPLPLRIAINGSFAILENELSERNNPPPTTLSATDIIIENDKIEVNKQIIWERKLLDLSLRNNLLNTRITKNTLQLISVHIHELEDALADGQEFEILAKPNDWDNTFMNSGIYQTIHATDPITNLVTQELKQKRLHSYLNEKTLNLSLTHLYRSSRLSMEENGANTLYLALGMLKWRETPSSTRPRFAPIILLPIEIIRKSAAKGYVIRGRDEETMINITLLEMLRQFFGIQIGGLEILPRDESGVDVTKIFNMIRRSIMAQDGWDIEEQAIIGNFSFSKFIMWNDIHHNADKLCQNKINT